MLHCDRLLPCGFLPEPLNADMVEDIAKSVFGVANEEKCAENVSFVEDDAE